MISLPDVEASVLGALLLEEEALVKVSHLLKPNDFTINANKHIYASLISLYDEGKDIDMHTISVDLKKKGLLEKAGGIPYMASLTHNIASSAHVETHARLLVECTVRRNMIKTCEELLVEAKKEGKDAFDLLEEGEKAILNVGERVSKKEPKKIYNLIENSFKEYEKAKVNPDGLIGVPSGFAYLDAVLRGFEKGSLTILGARPSMGKTALLLQMFRQGNVPALFCSLEMSEKTINDRLLAQETGIPLQVVRERSFNEEDWMKLYKDTAGLIKMPLFIDDTPALSLFELKTKARRLKHSEKIELIVIDYLQLMRSGGEGKLSREQEISTISRGLKELAKELDLAIVVASQLSRALETRGGDKRPLLSDLRESGAIEQDADVVMFLYRPAYYGLTQDEEGNSVEGLAELSIAKNRNGMTGTITIEWHAELAKFSNPGAF